MTMAAIAVTLMWTFAPLPALLKSNEELAKVKAQLAKAKKQNKQLEKQIKSMNKDEFVEKVARQQLDLSMPDEETYVVVKEPATPKKKKKLEPKESSVIQPIIDFFTTLFQ